MKLCPAREIVECNIEMPNGTSAYVDRVARKKHLLLGIVNYLYLYINIDEILVTRLFSRRQQ